MIPVRDEDEVRPLYASKQQHQKVEHVGGCNDVCKIRDDCWQVHSTASSDREAESAWLLAGDSVLDWEPE